MDGARFDNLARTLATDASRRSILKTLLGAAGGLVVTASGARPAGAQACRAAGRLCTQDANCCSCRCDPATRQCACPTGQENCRGLCKDPGTDYRADTSNCGGCGRYCPAPVNAVATCADGTCGFACRVGYADCNVALGDGCETVLATDPDHCGACGAPCSGNHMATRTCAGGTCTGQCAPGFADCNGDKRFSGCEVDTLTDVNHCGGCGQRCEASKPANSVVGGCNAGVCSYACAFGFADCAGAGDGCETNTQTDPANCGGCGNRCQADETCVGGTCRCGAGESCDPNQVCSSDGCITCVSGSTPCGTSCVRCVGGTVNAGCTCVCPGGQTLCRGACVDPATFASDPNNCGGCGRSCNDGTCSGGVCVCNGETCQTGETCFGSGCDCCGSGYCNVPLDGGPYQCGTFGGCVGKCGLGETCDLEDTDGRCRCGTNVGGCGAFPGEVVICHNSHCCSQCPANESFGTGCECRCGSGPGCGASGSCVGGSCQCGGGPPCGSGQYCSTGVCCPTGTDNCGGICKNTPSDPNNCGYCDIVCGPDATCSNDLCHCTSSGATCNPLEHCVAGECRCGENPGCDASRGFHCGLAGNCGRNPDPALTNPGRR